MPTLEVCFTPDLYSNKHTEDKHVTIVIDVLRATTAMCTALEYGIKAIIPVAEIEELKSLKKLGYLIASEREGLKLSFADFGNSPFDFMNSDLKGQIIAYSTTNGTRAIDMITEGSSEIYIAAYSNISAMCDFLISKNENVVIVCSGWKNKFSLEDALISGAFCEMLLKNGKFTTICDSSTASIGLWNLAKNDIIEYSKKCIHSQRLKKLKLDDCIEYCFTADTTKVVPMVIDGMIQNIK